jgi:hypothetical protein
MKIIVIALGLLSVLLGGLWLLQGLGLVHIQPILCVADCAPLEGPSPLWTAIGAVFVAAGGSAIFWASRRNGLRRR